MKKLVSVLLALSLVFSLSITAALADGEEKLTYTTVEYSEPFIYTKDDKDFKANYKTKECDEQGTIVRLEYDTPAYAVNEIFGAEETLHKAMNIYLPYGYDAATQYNILYLMHGGGENEEYWLGKDKEINGGRPVFGATTQNVLDNMIKDGLCDPVIVVCPTFYSIVEGKEITADLAAAYGEKIGDQYMTNEACVFAEFFKEELRNNIIPFVETTYSTYAGGDVSLDSLIASRDHRAFAGFSMGSMVSIHSAVMGCADIMAYVGSWSGALTPVDRLKEAVTETFGEYRLKYWYNGEGVEDIAYNDHVGFHNEVMAELSDVFVDGENYAFVMLENGNHAWTSWITELYNVLLVFFKK